MTTYAADTDGACVCVDCLHGACVTGGRWCEAEHCRCECRNRLIADDADRARELDDRPAEKLASIARDIEYEARPEPAELTAERYDRPSTAWRREHCRSCSQPIIWAVTNADKSMPVDAQPVPHGNLRLVPRGEVQAPRAEVAGPGAGRYVSHFVTCPQAKRWRKRSAA